MTPAWSPSCVPPSPPAAVAARRSRSPPQSQPAAVAARRSRSPPQSQPAAVAARRSRSPPQAGLYGLVAPDAKQCATPFNRRRCGPSVACARSSADDDEAPSRSPVMRRLAMPFLVTASLSASAGAHAAPPADGPTVKPPAPQPTAPPSTVHVPGGRIVRDASGRCLKLITSKCPPTAKCNPPPPRAVPCPPALLPAARPGEQIIRKSDGTCAGFTPITCTPDATCNPPSPRPIRCPEPPNAPKSAGPASTIFAPPPPK
ncbi:MAG: hypothetical protein ACI9U2_002281 [Bradymonadia bacterium]|jgi:hypothetical protein